MDQDHHAIKYQGGRKCKEVVQIFCTRHISYFSCSEWGAISPRSKIQFMSFNDLESLINRELPQILMRVKFVLNEEIMCWTKNIRFQFLWVNVLYVLFLTLFTGENLK